MWFHSWSEIVRVFLVGFATYALLIVFLRVSGKRTLTKLNAFDLVVTVAMGSTLSSALLSKDVALAESAAAFGVLVLGQYVIAKLSVRSRRFAKLIRSDPVLLVARGRYVDAALHAERVTRDEVLSAIRGAGLGRLEDAGAVVLESDGSLHVVPAPVDARSTSLEHVSGAPG